jgi:hypothetical protein
MRTFTSKPSHSRPVSDHALQNDRLVVRWDAAWRNWVRKSPHHLRYVENRNCVAERQTNIVMMPIISAQISLMVLTADPHCGGPPFPIWSLFRDPGSFTPGTSGRWSLEDTFDQQDLMGSKSQIYTWRS